MAARPATAPQVPQTLRTEVLKELQTLIDNREARDRLDRGPLAETKGREHWVLHLMLRGFEAEQLHVNQLIGSAYSNLLARLQTQDERMARVDEFQRASDAELKSRLESLEGGLAQKLQTGLDASLQQLTQSLNAYLSDNLDKKWKPLGDSLETFSLGSKQILKDVADTYRVATQTRLLLNENARRITDLGRDLIALEESLKLVVSKTLEEALTPFEQRLSAIEAHLGIGTPPNPPVRNVNGTPPETQA